MEFNIYYYTIDLHYSIMMHSIKIQISAPEINGLIFFTIVPDEVGMVNLTRGVENGSPTLLISWNAVPSGGGALITYTVRYSISSGTTTEPPSEASNKTGITGTSTTLSGLTQDTMYYIWVAAVSSGGQGPYSTRVSETTYEGIFVS